MEVSTTINIPGIQLTEEVRQLIEELVYLINAQDKAPIFERLYNMWKHDLATEFIKDTIINTFTEKKKKTLDK